MAHSYGPGKQWARCTPKRVEITSVRGWEPSGTIDLEVRSHPSLDEQLLRLSREEAGSLLEALRRVLDSKVSCSWNLSVVARET